MEIWISFVVFCSVLCVGVLWTHNRITTQAQHADVQQCTEGELTLHIATSDTPQAHALLESYMKSNPVERDHCVRTEIISDVSTAALALIPGTKEKVVEHVTAAGRTPSADTFPIAFTTPIGVATLDGAEHPQGSWKDVADNGITVPAKTPSLSSAVAATAMSSGDPEHAMQILRSNSQISLADAASSHSPRIALAEYETPTGYSFYSPDDLNLTTLAVPLNTTGPVTEDESRAAAQFSRFLMENVPQMVPTEEQKMLYTTAQVVSERYATLPESSRGSIDAGDDTLILLDSSNAMAQVMGDHSLFAHTIMILDPLITSVGRAGGQIGLWNYSSPLNPGVTKGWRSNVDLDDKSAGQNAINALKGLGTGGEPWTRSTLINALKSATEHATLTNKTARVILITSGTADRLSDADYRNALTQYDNANIHLFIIHVSDSPVDDVISQWAQEHRGSVTLAHDVPQLSTELQNAFGVERP